MFREAIKNVLNNALDHGGGGLTQVSLLARHHRNDFVVEISDDGKGIAAEAFNRALDRFSQIGPSSGSGLGLPIAKAVAERFGGGIELRNDQDRFVVSLRFQRDHAVEPA